MQVHVSEVPRTRFAPLPGQEGDPDVRFLVSGEQTGTPVCLFRCVFPPGALHGRHRHGAADEFVYIVRGHAAAGEGDDEIEAPAGTAIYTPRNQVHWIRNISESEDLELFGGFAGVGSLEAAGYEFVGEISRSTAGFLRSREQGNLSLARHAGLYASGALGRWTIAGDRSIAMTRQPDAHRHPGGADGRPVVVVGAHVQGLVLEVQAIPREGESVMAWDFREPLDGGKSSNQAVAAARLGVPTILVSGVGSDERGQRALRFFASEGIDTRYCITVDGATDVGFVLLPPSRVPAIAAALDCNLQLTPAVVEVAAGAIRRAACVVCALEAPQETVEAAFRIARAASVTTILNPAPAAELAPGLAEVTDVLVPNEHEAAVLAGCEGEPGELAAALARKLRIPDIVITAGSAGAHVRTAAGDVRDVGADSVTAVDTTGAGDAFVAALAVSLRNGRSVAEAAHFAVRVATVSVQRPGSMPSYPALHEL